MLHTVDYSAVSKQDVLRACLDLGVLTRCPFDDEYQTCNSSISRPASHQQNHEPCLPHPPLLSRLFCKVSVTSDYNVTLRYASASTGQAVIFLNTYTCDVEEGKGALLGSLLMPDSGGEDGPFSRTAPFTVRRYPAILLRRSCDERCSPPALLKNRCLSSSLCASIPEGICYAQHAASMRMYIANATPFLGYNDPPPSPHRLPA